MTTVFLGGSRQISRINAEVRKRLDKIIDNDFRVLIGDANGADKAIQHYLHLKGYPNVEVFCAAGACRNNIGDWKVRSVATKSHVRDFSFYAMKDQEMTKEATVGMMIWDGKSIGTLLNTLRLLTHGKKVVLYATPQKRFWELRTLREWNDFVGNYDDDLRRKIENKAALESTEVRTRQKAFIF
jgi:hypothetical protein